MEFLDPSYLKHAVISLKKRFSLVAVLKKSFCKNGNFLNSFFTVCMY
uniref:Uncharacterized protein n=1 Tax=Anguilla anguilla TaxID=7936 RepID=A0A0E9S491_ANGAN